jgi:phytanoyl-CoA hydroxylase
MRISGHIDRTTVEMIEGWFLDRDDISHKFHLEVHAGGALLGYCVADQYRDDLEKAGIGDGYCAFRFVPPPAISEEDLKSVKLKVRESDLVYLPPTEGIGVEKAATGASPAGGLWIDRPDWIDRLAEKVRREQITPELSIALFEFLRDGCYIIREAVAPDLVAKLNKEIETYWKNPPPGLTMETLEPDGQIRRIAPDIRYRAGRSKLLDLFTISALAREATAAKKIGEFLTAIFADTPKAFQSLYYYNGSEQAIQKDTAYVTVDSNPRALVTTWLALEDVTPGAGELEYYAGSHRAPAADAEKYGHVKSSFLAKAGDVLIWHADLVHGDAPIAKPGATRKSLVTRFTAAGEEPFDRRHANFKQRADEGFVFVSQYSDIEESASEKV